MNPRPGWHKYSWMAEFVAADPHYAANTIETTRLAIEARRHLFEMAERESIDFDLEQRGILHVYTTRRISRRAARSKRCSPKAALTGAPSPPTKSARSSRRCSGDFYGGFYTPSDLTGDIHKFTRGLARRASAVASRSCTTTSIESVGRVGTRFACRSSARRAWRARPSGIGSTDRRLCGRGRRDIAAMLGDRVNIYPVKGYSITVGLDDEASQQAAPWVSLLDDQAKIVTSRLGGDRFRVAGTAEFNGINSDIRAERIAPLSMVAAAFSRHDTRRPFRGRLASDDAGDDAAGVEGRQAGVFYNTGHGHLGWTLSAATAQLVVGATAA